MPVFYLSHCNATLIPLGVRNYADNADFFFSPLQFFPGECVGVTGKSRNFAAEFLTPKNNNENKDVQGTDDQGRQGGTKRAADGKRIGPSWCAELPR